MTLPDVSVEPADWRHDEAGMAHVRRTVFIAEQGVPEVMEWEAIDPECDWFVGRQGECVVGVARLTPDGRIGRMAVLPEWRGQGVGRRLLQAALARARERKLGRVLLNAQVSALAFYAKAGFRVEGPEFVEAGIAHRRMFIDL